jgi:hypothetical protein
MLLEIRKKLLTAVNHTPQVNPHEPFKIFITNVFQGFCHNHTGIIDKEVHPAMFLHCLFGITLDPISICYIYNMGSDSDISVADHVGRLFESFLVNIRDGNMAAFIDQVHGQRPPNTGRGAGYSRYLVS